MYVNPSEGHDDFLISLALCTHALKDTALPTPIYQSVIIPPQYGWNSAGQWYRRNPGYW